MSWNNLYTLSPVFRKVIARITPRSLRSLLRVNYVLMLQMGHLRSVRTRQVTWRNKPCPWFTYAAIEYLDGLDFSGRAVFEYGSGFSSLYWVGAGARLVTVDHDPEWHSWLRNKLPADVEAFVEPDFAKYPRTIEHHGQMDVIVVDGVCREACAQSALSRLSARGMIILDNSDWYPHTAAVLRQANLIQIDFHGFAPGVDFRCTTSVFLAREADFGPRSERQPLAPIGGMPFEETRRIWPPSAQKPLEGGSRLPPS